jgi:hypothetical protein
MLAMLMLVRVSVVWTHSTGSFTTTHMYRRTSTYSSLTQTAAGSHPDPPPNAYGNYTPSPHNHFQPGFGGSLGFPSQPQNGSNFAQHMKNNSSFSPARQGSLSFAFPVQPQQKVHSATRRFGCTICGQQLPKNILVDHVKRCKAWSRRSAWISA